MTQKLHTEINNVLTDVDRILNGDRPTTHGDIADFAATFTELHTAYLSGMMRAQRNPNALDAYAIQIIQKLARIANSAPEYAEPHFIDIAGYAVSGTAHTRVATANQAEADSRRVRELGDSGTTIIPEGEMIPDSTPLGTDCYAERKGAEPQYIGRWQGPDIGLQGGPAPKG